MCTCSFGRTRRHFLRRCKQRSDFDVESEIRERRGDDLLPAIMPILSHLGDQDPRSAAFVLGEGAGHCDHTFVGLGVRPSLREIDAGDGASLRDMTAERLLQGQGDLPDGSLRPRRFD